MHATTYHLIKFFHCKHKHSRNKLNGLIGYRNLLAHSYKENSFMNKSYSKKLRSNSEKSVRRDILHLNCKFKSISGVENRLCDNMLHMAQNIMERKNIICQ